MTWVPLCSTNFHTTVFLASHRDTIVTTIEPSPKVKPMFWKIFRLQKMLDALFDDGWGSLGLPDALDSLYSSSGDWTVTTTV
jgi:hypothetical protein